MMPETKIGLVGCGAWGSYILRDLNSLGCRVVAVAASDDSKRRAVEGMASQVVASIGDLPDIQGVVVATPTATHADVVEELLDRNIPIFVEKPLTADPERAARLARLAPDRIFVMDKWRYHPGIEMLRDIAATEELGPVLGLRCRRVQWNTPHSDVDDVWILAPHDLSICLEILGYIPEPRAAVGELIDAHGKSLTAFLGDDPWCVIETSGRYHKYVREIRLHCRDGIAILDDGYSDNVQIVRPAASSGTVPPAPELRPIATEFPLLRELRAFVGHINGGPPPRSSATEGAALVRTLGRLRELAGLSRLPSLA